MERAVETIRDLLNRAERHLVKHGVPNARRNAEWMMCSILEMRMLDLYVRSHETVEMDEALRYWRVIERRASREPLQYILGNTEFMSLPFLARPGVFVPRPDTEILVEHAEKRLRRVPLHDAALVLDLCSGSGIIGVSIARRVPNTGVTAVDVSEAAVELTAENAVLNGVSDRVRLVQDDGIEYLATTTDRFLAILCNPPYIPSGELAGLPREVRDHEPMTALDGGVDGLDFYRRAIPEMVRCLLPGGFVAFEIGDEQGDDVAGLLEEAGFTGVDVIEDLSGRDRVVTGTK